MSAALAVSIGLNTPVAQGVEVSSAAAQSTTAEQGATNAEILRQLNQDLVSKRINLFRSSVRTSTKSKSFFSRLMASPVGLMDSELLSEMNQFTARYLAQPETAEVFYLKGQVHQRNELYQAAALDWLLVQVIYPESSFAVEAAKSLNALSADALRKQSALLAEMTQKLATLKETDREQRLAAYLRYLGNLSDEKFAAPIAAECSAFLSGNQSYLREDQIVHATARQAMLFDNQVALYHFNKVLSLYPNSSLRTDSLWSIAHVQRHGLKQYDEAEKSYLKLIGQYPDAPETKLAYEALASLYDEDMRDYPNASKTYLTLLEKYPGDPVALRSLQALALLYQNKTNQPANAIEMYLKLADATKGNEALEALSKAEKISLGMRNWKQAIEINDRISALAPQSEHAASALYDNAVLTENKLGDKEAAKKRYSDFVSRYPTHPLVADANKRLAALTADSPTIPAQPVK